MNINDYPYLSDYSFLNKLYKEKNKIYYVRVSILTKEENPVEIVTGRVIDGNINIDNNSTIRRTGNISFIVDENVNKIMNTKNLFSINKKINLEIGLKNFTDKYINFKIIWFPQGVYGITDASITNDSNGLKISLQIKDKMCFLNGECGGTFPCAVELDIKSTYDEETESWQTDKVVIPQIIMELMNHWGEEPLEKIWISDLDLKCTTSMSWNGDNTLYAFDFISDDGKKYIRLTTDEKIGLGKEPYKIFNKGDYIGNFYCDFIYNKDLIAENGSTIVDALEKIKNYLNNYEYFYDTYGNFRFQEIKNYLNTKSENPILKQDYSNSYYLNEPFKLDDSFLISSYSNSPQYGSIKNDFVIWGKKKIDNNLEVPIRYHLAIDNKPYTEEGQDWRTKILLEGREAEKEGLFYSYYYPELKEEWEKIYDIERNKFKEESIKDPNSVNYFLDFIDSPSISELSIPNIGRRTISIIDDDNINCVFEPEDIPDIYILDDDDFKNGKWKEINFICATYIGEPDIYENSIFGAYKYNSAYEVARQTLHQYVSYNENIVLNTIPMFHLEPNTLIKIKDDKSNIDGDYIINNISISLNNFDTMTLSCTKNITRI